MAEREKGAMKPQVHLRLGIADALMGKYNSGLDHLNKAGDIGLALYFKGLSLENLQRWPDAAKAFAAAKAAGYDPKRSDLHRVGALRRAATSRRPARSSSRSNRSPASRPNTTTSSAACSPPRGN